MVSQQKIGKAVSFEEMKQLQLEMLLEFDAFCKEHDIKYWLCGGTLIGAVRHKGYIPWDDDIDVYLPREEHDRFVKLYHSSKYELFYEGREGYYIPVTKISDPRTILVQKAPINIKAPFLGVHLDVLPLDGVPTNLNKHVAHVAEIMTLKTTCQRLRFLRFNRLPMQPKAFLGGILTLWKYRKRSLDNLLHELIVLCRKYKYSESKFVGFLASSPYNYNERYERSWFEGSPVMVDFEGYKFPAPHDYHSYLTAQFGDYMQLPPVEARKTTHVGTAFWVKD